MDVVPGSDIQRAVESDCSQPNSRTNYLYQVEPINCVENREDDMFEYGDQLNDSLLKTEGQGPTVSELLANSYCRNTGDLFFDFQVENQKKSCSLHAIEDNDINEPRLTSANSLSIVDLTESESPNTGKEGALSFSEPTWLKEDVSIALWVKWRGTWQVCIKCARADWPLSTLKAKPTHEQKRYFVIFFPLTKVYFWADTLLVRSIDEFPQPIAYKTHQEGLEMVKDLSVARRFIMQKLAVSILNTLDQLHSNALVGTACDVMVWKELAMEASRCNTYSDLGRMLLKLLNSIAPCYINADWVNSSSDSWAERCQNTISAESLELLKEEVVDSILWNDVQNFGGVPVQPTLGSEWKTWKQDVMKWFSTPPSFSSSSDMQQTPDSAYRVSLQIGRNRRKLQVRRAYTHTSLAGTKGSDHSTTLETNPGFSKNQDAVSALAIVTSEQEIFREVHVETDLPSNLTDQWNEIVVEGIDSEVLNCNGMESTPIDEMAGEKIMEPGTKNQQCIAYVEAKGRQCVRSANDGNKYCGVHIRSLSCARQAKKPVPIETPMCGGTANAGTRCKHHSLPDSPFWKKHWPRAETCSKLKRKHEGNCTRSEGLICKDMVLVNDESPLQVDPVSATHGDCFLDKLPGNLALSDNDHNATEDALHCLGCPPYDNEDPCLEPLLWYVLYCEKHLPNWLKRSRNGKRRIISKELFTEILRDCSSWEQKVHLHKACAIFYILFKSILRNPESKAVQFQCAMTEATKDPSVAELLKRLIISEKDRIKLVLGLDDDIDISSLMEGTWLPPTAINDSFDDENGVKCKICNAEFADDRTLGYHWMGNHEKETQCLFRGFACAICLSFFTEKKLLENHVQGRHRMQFVEQCSLLQCIPCGSHFGNMEQLWLHVLSVHPVEFKLQLKVPEQETLTVLPCEASLENLEQGNSASLDNDSQDPGTLMKFSCRHCELKFNLLPDLGRHHQAAHMERNQISSKVAKRRALSSAHRLESGRLGRSKIKKGSSAASCRTRSRANANLKRRIQETKSLRVKGTTVHLNSGSLQKGIVCDDISFGKESIPVICVEDQETLNSQFQSPWESFTYVTKPRLYQSLIIHDESLRMGCYCSFSTCCPETCDHVCLFDNDFDDAKDVFGKPMRGRFPYDENGRIILEEGYLVYECNNLCRCNKSCPNRILQNGIRVKLEVFKTEKKGWGVRAGEAILRGTFICELIGEVLDEREAHVRLKRYGKEHCSYFYDIDARFNDISRMIEGQPKYVIDATSFGNVSRFINSSCSPNLVNYQVFVESMDCKRSHIGLYASRDIALGEELTFDYHKVGPGKGTPCLCGSSNCGGRLY